MMSKYMSKIIFEFLKILIDKSLILSIFKLKISIKLLNN